MIKRISTSMEIRALRRNSTQVAEWSGQQQNENATQDGSLDEITPRANVKLQRKETDKQREQREQGEQKGHNTSPLQERPKVPLRRMRKLSRPASTTLDRLASATFLPRKRVSLPQIPRLAYSSTDLPRDAQQLSPGCLLPRSKGTKMGLDGPIQMIPESAPRKIRRPTATDTSKIPNYFNESSQQSLSDENYDMRAAFGDFRSTSQSSTMSKRSGKWSWSGWFS